MSTVSDKGAQLMVLVKSGRIKPSEARTILWAYVQNQRLQITRSGSDDMIDDPHGEERWG